MAGGLPLHNIHSGGSGDLGPTRARCRACNIHYIINFLVNLIKEFKKKI